MFREEKNLKDKSLTLNSENSPLIFNLSYKKTNKLITALYMVTDILDNNEPIRHKLRLLGVEVLSDITNLKFFNRTDKQIEAEKKIVEIISILELGATVMMISEMNVGVLKKEFFELKNALSNTSQNTWLDEFLAKGNDEKENLELNKHPIRIGVQKGENLLKALQNMNMSDRNKMSDIKTIMSDKHPKGHNSEKKTKDFDMLKKERRFEIVNIIEKNPEGATITDIKNFATGVLKTCGEKTLQRELVSMVLDGVLEKKGDKRWSKYKLKKMF